MKIIGKEKEISRVIFSDESKSDSSLLKNFNKDKTQKVLVIEQDKELLIYLKKQKNPIEYIQLGFDLRKHIDKYGIKNINLTTLDMGQEELCYLVEGIIHAEYKFTYKTDSIEPQEIGVHLNMTDLIQERIDLMESVFWARDLINTPSSRLTPIELAKNVREKLTSVGVEVEVYNKEQIEELNLKAFLAVAQGSHNQPRFIVAKYLPNKDEKPIILVGKGLTYDSGGFSLKPPRSMVYESVDMGGAATAAATLYAISKRKIKRNVMCIVATCENMLSDKAYRLGDVIDTYLGKTVYVNNTDAEGRLTLADAIGYAQKNFNPECIIDLATLTGACVSALGHVYTGAITNNRELYYKLEKATFKHDEHVWMLPTHDRYRKALHHSLADLVNSNASFGAGTITAALFIEEFVGENKWLHLDIAGTSDLRSADGYLPAEGNGTLVKSLYQMIKDYDEN